MDRKSHVDGVLVCDKVVNLLMMERMPDKTWSQLDADTPVDVIITSYQYGRYLGRAIDSALNQTHRAVRVIVVDDASPDETEAVARRYGQITYLKNSENIGCVRSMMRGFNQSQSPLVVFLDADDQLEPDCVETLLNALLNDSNAAFAYSPAQLTGDGQGIYQSYPFSKFRLSHAGNYIIKTGLIRREAFSEAGGFKVELESGQEDWDLWLSFAERNFYGVLVNRPLVSYTVHPASRNARFADNHADKRGNIELIRKLHPKIFNWQFKLIHPLFMIYWLIHSLVHPNNIRRA